VLKVGGNNGLLADVTKAPREDDAKETNAPAGSSNGVVAVNEAMEASEMTSPVPATRYG
jgi:hypothetical protein